LESLTKSQTFSPDWPELGHIRAEQGSHEKKTWFSTASEQNYIVFMYKYYKLTWFSNQTFCSDWSEIYLIAE